MAQCCKNHGELAIHWSDGAKRAKSELNFIYQLFVWIRCMCYIYNLLCCQSGFPTCPCASFSKQSHLQQLYKNKTEFVRLQIHRPPTGETSCWTCASSGQQLLSCHLKGTWRPFSCWSLDLKKLMDLSELSPPWVSCDLGIAPSHSWPICEKTVFIHRAQLTRFFYHLWIAPTHNRKVTTAGCESLLRRDLCLSKSCDRS